MRPGETVCAAEGRNSIAVRLSQTPTEAINCKLSSTLLEPATVGWNNCLGVNYCMYGPGAVCQGHRHESLEQVTYVCSGAAKVNVNMEERTLRKDEGVYVACQTVHGLENAGSEPLATVNAYYSLRGLWSGDVQTFLTKVDPMVERRQLRYPREI